MEAIAGTGRRFARGAAIGLVPGLVIGGAVLYDGFVGSPEGEQIEAVADCAAGLPTTSTIVESVPDSCDDFLDLIGVESRHTVVMRDGVVAERVDEVSYGPVAADSFQTSAESAIRDTGDRLTNAGIGFGGTIVLAGLVSAFSPALVNGRSEELEPTA